jgi:hypothetical protein
MVLIDFRLRSFLPTYIPPIYTTYVLVGIVPIHLKPYRLFY